MQPIRLLLTASVVALLVPLTACTTAETERNLEVTALVDGYPAPVDPVMTPRRPRPPEPPKLIINGPKSTLIYPCQNVHSEVLRDALEGFLSPEGTVEASADLNKLIVSDVSEEMPTLLRVLQELDKATPQILVEVRVIEVTMDKDAEFGLSHLFRHIEGGAGKTVQDSSVVLTTPGSAPASTLGALMTLRSLTGSTTLDSFVRLLMSEGSAKILSSPNLIVTSGKQASIITGEEVPIQSATVVSGSVSTTTTFKRVGIKLYVMPSQITSDSVRLEINPEVSTVTGFTSAGESGISSPIVAVRNCRTTLTIKDGQLLTIGGLLRSENHKLRRRVPILGSIPLLGYLFQSRRDTQVKTMLVFFLRVHILDEGRVGSIIIHKPGAGLEKLDEATRRALIGEASGPSLDSEGVLDPAPVAKPLDPIIIDVTPPSEEADEPDAGDVADPGDPTP
jgi:general secretion pathway protein D